LILRQQRKIKKPGFAGLGRRFAAAASHPSNPLRYWNSLLM
jgi:hypothetical protein